jgi:hypothetical protein
MGAKLRVFEDRVLRIFGPKINEIITNWRKPHNEELHNCKKKLSLCLIKYHAIKTYWGGVEV